MSGGVLPQSLVALLLAAILACAARAADPLPQFFAEYTITRNGVVVGIHRNALTKDSANRYVYESYTRASGAIAWLFKDRVRERSVWMPVGERLRPLSYSYSHSGGKTARAVQLEFDWEHRLVRNTIDGDSWRMAIPEDALDKLLVQLAAMVDLARGREHMDYHIADGGRLKVFRYERQGKERLETPAGVFDTVRVQRARDDKDHETVLWTAPALHFLPVRIQRREEDDSLYQLVLTEYRGR